MMLPRPEVASLSIFGTHEGRGKAALRGDVYARPTGLVVFG